MGKTSNLAVLSNALEVNGSGDVNAVANLGVGVASPAAKLDVNGNARVNGNILGTGASTSVYNASGDMYVRGGTGSKLSLGANNTNDLAVLSTSGNFGIGVASPVARLDVGGDYKEKVNTANTGTAYTINLSNGTIQILTLTDNCTFTFPSAIAGKSFMLLLMQDGIGGRTVVWPASVKWPENLSPTVTPTANKLDKYVFTADGANWYGSNGGQNYTV